MPRPFCKCSVLFVTIYLLCAAPLLTAGPDPKLNSLADQMARGINQNLSPPPSKNHEVTVLVFDFADNKGEMTQLGIQLADQLTEALRNRIPGLKPAKRSDLRDFIERERLDSAEFQSDAVAHWAARTLEVNLSILGTIDAEENGIELHLRVIGRDHRKRVAQASALLDWSVERHLLHNRSVLPLASSPHWKDVPVADLTGRGKPKCLDCPQPGYSEAARMARIEGRAVAQVLVGKDGRVQDVALLRGLPCGLSNRVITMLKLWRFEPVPGSKGEPAVVQFPVEINFHLM